MRVRVNFRVNTETGDVETFLIEDISIETEPEHEKVHDRLAYEVGKVVERRPRPEQVVGGTAHDELVLAYPDEEPEQRKQDGTEQDAG